MTTVCCLSFAASTFWQRTELRRDSRKLSACLVFWQILAIKGCLTQSWHYLLAPVSLQLLCACGYAMENTLLDIIMSRCVLQVSENKAREEAMVLKLFTLIQVDHISLQDRRRCASIYRSRSILVKTGSQAYKLNISIQASQGSHWTMLSFFNVDTVTDIGLLQV